MSEQTEQIRAVVLLRHDGKIFLMTTEGQVHGFLSSLEAARYFERSYNRGHARSYEGSMSACIHCIFYEPKILQLGNGETIEEVKRLLGPGPYTNYKLASVAGRMTGILLPEENWHYHETALQVNLITE